MLYLLAKSWAGRRFVNNSSPPPDHDCPTMVDREGHSVRECVASSSWFPEIKLACSMSLEHA